MTSTVKHHPFRSLNKYHLKEKKWKRNNNKQDKDHNHPKTIKQRYYHLVYIIIYW